MQGQGRIRGERSGDDVAELLTQGDGHSLCLAPNAELAQASQEGLNRVEVLGAADSFKLELADDLEPLHLGLGLAATPRGHAVVSTRSSVRRARERLKGSETARRAYDSARPLLARLARPKDVLKG